MKNLIPILLVISSAGCVTLKDLPWNKDVPESPQEAVEASDMPEGIHWMGQSFQAAERDPRASIERSHMNTHKIWYDLTVPKEWPKKKVKVWCQAIACFGYEKNGKIYFGKYDWMRVGGQGVKGTENIHDGYNGLEMPFPGTKCYTMLVSVDGKLRSNFIEIEWK